ncbi:hypothetical protein F4819DRAFT_492162 [Hypoxylon fuscum]|nr:hypothetical protein F4819DRAFT_492162 [Hypoxylon fuscum]
MASRPGENSVGSSIAAGPANVNNVSQSSATQAQVNGNADTNMEGANTMQQPTEQPPTAQQETVQPPPNWLGLAEESERALYSRPQVTRRRPVLLRDASRPIGIQRRLIARENTPSVVEGLDSQLGQRPPVRAPVETTTINPTPATPIFNSRGQVIPASENHRAMDNETRPVADNGFPNNGFTSHATGPREYQSALTHCLRLTPFIRHDDEILVHVHIDQRNRERRQQQQQLQGGNTAASHIAIQRWSKSNKPPK